MRIDDWFSLEIFAIRRWRTVRCGETEAVPFAQPQITELRSADAHRTFQHGLEDGLQLAGRTRNNTQHFRRRRLLFQSFRKLSRPRLHLVEQSSVLDGDHRLVGEGLQQFNLSVGKWTHLGATQGNCPDGFASTNKRDGQYGVVAKTPGGRTSLWIFIRLRLHIGEVNRLSVEDCTRDGGTSTR